MAPNLQVLLLEDEPNDALLIKRSLSWRRSWPSCDAQRAS